MPAASANRGGGGSFPSGGSLGCCLARSMWACRRYRRSFGIALAIAAVGFYHIFGGLRKARTAANSSDVTDGAPAETRGSRLKALLQPPAGRGDISIWLGIGIYLFSTMTYVVLCHFLVPD